MSAEVQAGLGMALPVWFTDLIGPSKRTTRPPLRRQLAQSRISVDKSAKAHTGETSGDDPDASLLEKIAQGDQGACRDLVARHLKGTFALARRMLGNEADAEDVAQETFMRVWRHAGKWEPGRARFETWLYRVTLNLCYDRLRRRREITVDVLPEVTDPALSVVEAHHRRDVAKAVEQAMKTLPERQRGAIVLCHYHGLSNVEAAAALEVSVEALESLLARGRRALRAALKDEAAELLGGM